MSTELPEQAAPPDPSPSAAGPVKPKAWVRLIALLAALFTGWHILASFLWIAPYSENAREIVPGSQDTLAAYMIPFFGQSWSVFAPDPINGDYHFDVRAAVADGSGQERETDWVSATDVELSMIRHHLFPPRAGIQSSEVASSYKDAYDAIEPQQRTVIGGDFMVDTGEAGLRAALERGAQTSDDDSDTAEIEQLLAEERLSTAYATQVAKAIWGDDVVRVQFRVSRQNIVPFAERNNPQAQRPEATVILPGWRGPIVAAGQNERNFAEVFRGQFDRMAR